MKNFKIFALLLSVALLLTGCARDLSSTTYTSDSTLNIVLEGIVVSTREVKIKESDRLSGNTTGTAIGSLAGGAAVAHSSNDNSGAVVGGVIAGAVIGTLAQNALSSTKGIEFIVKVDKSKLSNDYYEGSALMRNAIAAVKATGMVTVIQTSEKTESEKIKVGENVLVIISENRSRVIRNMNK